MATVKLSRIFVVEERSNPSTDFFVAPKLQQSGTEVEHCNLQQTPEIGAGEQVALVFVRYVSKAWQQWLQQHRLQVHRLIYFMDDDLFDLAAFRGLPWRYRYKLARLAYSRRKWLQQNKAELWVSTPFLQSKYAFWQPKLVQACLPSVQPAQLTLFYHGSASHQAEIEWLKPVVAGVLEEEPAVSFEIIGNSEINWLYRGLPRVHVLHPMSWPAYQALLARGQRDIGLAPLLAGRFNQARSYTKFFDITRARAVGLYSEGSIYQQVVQHDDNGLLLPNEPQRWADAIVDLVRQPERRQRLQQQAVQSCQRLENPVWEE
ncbi:glycosyltransferase family 1 protein [Alkalimonas delamerensis]|uniref:Glycosyltransferase family 1 protein n=1 Tax=Alkalimonas delamerensis TaxID=265981 RepID=A0ABT9GPZ6_9GAMM|nr:glycosyltransferase family 1 protein [Alkalimonas delamerensis]MDP4528969.1 glycosyltransferase family 1 protein [Alkalimonas delamerensis]